VAARAVFVVTCAPDVAKADEWIVIVATVILYFQAYETRRAVKPRSTWTCGKAVVVGVTLAITLRAFALMTAIAVIPIGAFANATAIALTLHVVARMAARAAVHGTLAILATVAILARLLAPRATVAILARIAASGAAIAIFRGFTAVDATCAFVA
jgi:hypothetical protein